MHVAVMEVQLSLPGVRSLKEKRGIVKSLLARVQQRFHVAVAEVAHQDRWQMAGLGFSAIGNDVAVLQRRMHKVELFIESGTMGGIVDFRVEFLA